MRGVGAAGRIVGALAGGWVAWRVFGPELPKRYPPHQVRPIRVTGRTVLVGEREFFVRETGSADAPPLVLIHGWSLDSELTYHAVVSALAGRYRIVMPDLRNHGKSDWVRGRYDVEDLADEVAGVLEVLQLPASAVMGYSLGGMVAQDLARRYPHLVRALILAATAARPVPTRRVLARIAFWLGRGIARISVREGARLTMAALEASGAVQPSHERWMYESLLRRDGNLFYEAGGAAVRFDSRSWVGRLRVPTTIVIPTEDLLVPTSAQRELAGLLPDSEVVELKGSGHESILTRAADYVAVIDEVMGRG